MLNNPIGILMYYLLRNDFSWRLLSKNEKKIILKANKNYNTTRDDYAMPDRYGNGRKMGGENWDSYQLCKNDYRGQVLLKVLKHDNPREVLEIGPGAGFYSNLICQYDSVEKYTAIDIGKAFLDYLQPRLKGLKNHKRFNYHLICGEVTKLILPEKFDLIVLLSTVHHIPNRIDLFNNLNKMLLRDGVIFCFDPSHYIFRITQLIIKFVLKGYLRKEYRLKRSNLSTHHMCSYGEYKKISKEISDLKIEEVFFCLPNRIKKFNKSFIPKKWFSSEIGVTFRKTA